MKNKKIILVMLGILFSLSLVSAISIDINMKESFGAGEEISFDYIITSSQTQEIEYAAFVNCPNAPLALLDIKTTSLEANVAFTEKYVYMSSVSEDIEPQTCNVTVGILSPETLEQKSFSIATNPGFEFNVELAKTVFVKDEEVEISFTSGVSPTVGATLIYPNGETQQLSLPAVIKAEQIGTYDLEIIASKQEYKTINKKVQFGVIEKAADIGYTSLTEEKEKSRVGKYLLFVLIGIIFVLAIVVFIKFFGRIKKRRRRKLNVERKLKRGLKKKERSIKKKERRLFRWLFHRKKKLPQGKKQEVNMKARQEKKVLTRQKVGARKEFMKRLGKEKKESQKREKRVGAQEKKDEVRRLLSKGRRQLANGNKFGAKNTYRKIRRIHGSLKKGEKNKDLYDQLLVFHGRLVKRKK